MSLTDKVSELAEFILSRSDRFKGMNAFEYQMHKIDLAGEIHTSIELWVDRNARGE